MTTRKSSRRQFLKAAAGARNSAALDETALKPLACFGAPMPKATSPTPPRWTLRAAAKRGRRLGWPSRLIRSPSSGTSSIGKNRTSPDQCAERLGRPEAIDRSAAKRVGATRSLLKTA